MSNNITSQNIIVIDKFLTDNNMIIPVDDVKVLVLLFMEVQHAHFIETPMFFATVCGVVCVCQIISLAKT